MQNLNTEENPYEIFILDCLVTSGERVIRYSLKCNRYDDKTCAKGYLREYENESNILVGTFEVSGGFIINEKINHIYQQWNLNSSFDDAFLRKELTMIFKTLSSDPSNPNYNMRINIIDEDEVDAENEN